VDRVVYQWAEGAETRELAFVHVCGTDRVAYEFGEQTPLSVHVADFLIATVAVTQAFWSHVADPNDNPAVNRGLYLPVENVSWDRLCGAGGFLHRLNESAAAASLRKQIGESFVLRLPSETEWEYAARGGVYWRDGFRYSGSNDIDAVAWYDRKHGDHTQPVAQKTPNQLGIYDMSGNVWEWCQDTFSPDVRTIPTDGTPYEGSGEGRVLRGGCFHNWAEHCTVSKRYQIERRFHDGCIGFRLVLSPTAHNSP
jgi:sulfatase modifying factor 1